MDPAPASAPARPRGPLPADLVDARTGVIRRVEPRATPAHFPLAFQLAHAVLADSTAFCGWASDASGAGHAFADPDAVRGAAVGEAVERYCGNLVPAGLVRDSARRLRAAGRAVLDPAALSLYSVAQHASGRLPVDVLDADAVVDWTEAERLGTADRVLVPASLVWVSHALLVPPAVHPIMQAGLATGRSREEALWGGLGEVVERDAMTRAWTDGEGVVELDVPRALHDLARGPDGALSCRWFLFPHGSGVPVLGALLADARTGCLTLGMASGGLPTRAARKALGEALQLQLFQADLDDPDGPYMAAARDPGSPLKPWRADRAYRLAYRDDLTDVVDYGCHLQLHLDPVVQRVFREELARSITGRIPLADASDRWGGRERLPELVEAMRARGHDVLAVDVTLPEVRRAGLHVMRVIVPGLRSNAPHALPFLGGPDPAPPRAPRPVPLPH
ncbi:ribosomal protein S12 methylthiotransferase accessory factor [Clavibacter sp. B3I6]|uniref:YcaO-like family protein n=1 Tax=Clavibacter sp. B3I6 TaxID=3042268 RepID=UPI002789FCE5|nr:YcaO-like family protein [Clavibacter sp. B3I6]MDQ0743146.1 ribosomal protein S12 methylthiotransferase accessory factor [Clavibacter sp. B3I6]